MLTTDQINIDNKHLQFFCGPYQLLVKLSHIIEIIEYKDNISIESGGSIAHHGKTSMWRDKELPYFDLRVILDTNTEEASEPLHIVVLQDPDTSQELALVAIDAVDRIVNVNEHDLYWFSGINSRIDFLFDRIYPDKIDDRILMRLSPSEKWIAELKIANNNGGINAY